MAQAPELDFDGFVSRKRSEKKTGDAGPPEPDGRAYAYRFDRQTREALERMRPIQLVVAKTVRMFKSVWRNQLLGSAVKVSDRQFPRIQKITEQCAATLGIPTPQVYITNNPTLNAGTYGTDDESFIIVHSGLVDHYTDQELLTVIGHECGHVHNGHVVYLTALHYVVRVAGVFLAWVLPPALVALNSWSRRAEITSDRAAMLCAKDTATAERAITKLALGSLKLYEEFNLEAFLEQHHEGRDGVGKYMEVFASHPWLPKRVLAMREFAQSDFYRRAMGLEGGAPMADVDERVSALLKGDAVMLEGFREKKSEVSRAIADVAAIARDVGARSLGERVTKDLVTKLDEDRFHLVVVGEFNHGKSTFVNALLGENVLATGVTPTTAAIHHVKWAEKPEATLVLTSGKREPIAFERARAFAVGGGADPKDVDFLEIGYPSPLLEERILLVDTPGVNDLSLQRADITYSYIPRADAVLFLLDAGQILKESERVFLQEKLLKGSRDKIAFVITKWDLLSPSEQGEALAYARAQLANLVKEPVVFPVSAEVALAGKSDGRDGGMNALLDYLTRFLAEERGRILLDNALGEGLLAGDLLAKGIDARRRSLAMKTDELDRRIAMLEQDLAGQAGTIEQRRAKIREEVQGIRVGARKDLERFIDDVTRQLPHVIESAKASQLKDYLPGFLEDTFRTWAEAESREIATSLEALAERTIALVREDAHKTAKRVAQTLGGGTPQRLDVHVDTLQYDVSVVALLGVGIGVMFANLVLGGLLTAAAPLLALVLKSKADEEYRKKALAAAPGVLRAVGERIGPKLDAMIDEVAKKLDAWVVSAVGELHQEVLEVLHATRSARAAGAADEAGALREVDAQAARLDAAVKRVTALRSALWMAKQVAQA